MLPSLARLSVATDTNEGDAKRDRADADEPTPSKKPKTAVTCLRTLYQTDSDKKVIEERSQFQDLPLIDDAYLPAYKEAALEAIYKSLNENISAVAQSYEKDAIRRKVAAIVNDTSSWTRQTAEALMRGTDVATTPEYAKNLVAALREVKVYDWRQNKDIAWDPTWDFKTYLRHTWEISKHLVDKAMPFFRELVQKYNDTAPCFDPLKEYAIHYRFDSASMVASGAFHMDPLYNRREYGHEPEGGDMHFFTSDEGYTVTFCYNDSLQTFECGTEVLLGTPTLTSAAMYKLSHVDGGALTARELYQIWNFGKNVAPEPGVDRQWQRSAWQSLANVMQNSAEGVIKDVGVNALLASGNYQLHKVRTHHLNNYAHYVFHRSDATSADPNKRDVRCFATVGQSAKEPRKMYHTVAMQVNGGHVVRVNVAWS